MLLCILPLNSSCVRPISQAAEEKSGAPAAVPTLPAPKLSLGAGARATEHLYDVLVIGGGASGLMCAHTLTSTHNHLNVCVLEARQRVGGRTCSVAVPREAIVTDTTEPQRIDVGGQWFGPTQTRALALAKQFGLRTYPQKGAQKAEGKSVVVVDGQVNTYQGMSSDTCILCCVVVIEQCCDLQV